ncbi:MAG: hypothetical protein ACHQVK_02315 [Candidatus Paceibacterales bacterium]
MKILNICPGRSNNDDQLQRYQECEKDAKAFIFIGLGGDPSNPGDVFLIPLSEIEYKGLY